MKNAALGSAKKASIGGRSEKKPRSMNPYRATARSRRSHHGLDYDAFAEDVRRDLNPRGPLESLVADRVIETAWQLKASLERRLARAEVAEGNPDKADRATRRAMSSAADRALRSLKDALGTLDDIQARHAGSYPGSLEPSPLAEEVDPAVVVFDPLFDGDASEWTGATGDGVEEDASPETPIWDGRLAFDFDVSDISPVVKGTWVTVNHVVSLIVDGYTWDDILRTHPELTREDIHACMVYAIDEQNEPK